MSIVPACKILHALDEKKLPVYISPTDFSREEGRLLLSKLFSSNVAYKMVKANNPTIDMMLPFDCAF